VVINFTFTGAGVQETFQKLLSLAVVLQLIPFLYMFGALLKIAAGDSFRKGRYSKTTLIAAGASGLLTTSLGIALAFFSGAADHILIFIRSLDGRRHAVFHWARGIFLLCVRPAQGSAKTGGSGACALN